MDILLEDFDNELHIKKFLKKNHIENWKVEKNNGVTKISISDHSHTKSELKILERHFAFYDIFHWTDKGIENVTLWEKPTRLNAVFKEYETLFQDLDFDVFASIEARGFIMGGIFAQKYKKPFIPIRKYKRLYKDMQGTTEKFINWKDDPEKLFVFDHSLKGKRVLFIDDILDTGRSLQAAEKILTSHQKKIVGAFYLMDNAEQKIRDQFDFPIKSLLRFKGLFNQ